MIGALKICEQIASGVIVVPMANAIYVAKNLVEPVIYPSVADRVALLKRPQATVEFYMRVQEAKAMAAAMAASAANLTPGQSGMTSVQPSHAASIGGFADHGVTA